MNAHVRTGGAPGPYKNSYLLLLLGDRRGSPADRERDQPATHADPANPAISDYSATGP